MMKILSLCLIGIFIAGCNSTPYNDDHAKHYNSLSKKDKTNPFTFLFADSQTIDLRGSYVEDDSVTNSSLLYAGDAGIIGLLLQVGVHSAIVNEQRDARLTESQNLANQQVSVLIEKSKSLDIANLTGKYQTRFSDQAEQANNTVHVKPIFFSNAKKNKLHMRMVAWIPENTKKSSKKTTFRYRNLIQVFGKTFNEEETTKLLAEDTSYLQAQLSGLLQMGLYMLNKDLKGLVDTHLLAKKSTYKTYLIGDEAPTVYRGKFVEGRCDFHIIKDLHSWLIAFPMPEDSIDESLDRPSLSASVSESDNSCSI